jgi:hypothetical protein
MSRKQELLLAFDDAWSYKWESLWVVLDGVTDEEAFYQHPVYSDTEQEPMHPPSGTILWHLVHLGQCYLHYRERIIHRPENTEAPDPPEAHSLEEGIQNLKRCRKMLRDTFESLQEEELEDKYYGMHTVAELARMVVRHDAWHSAQIAVARRLYRMRNVGRA